MPQAYGTSKELYYNVEKRKLCDAAGVPLAAGYDRLLVTSFAKYVLKMTFLNGDGTAAADWSGQVAFWAEVDDNYAHATAGYCTVLNAAFNVVGDWVEDSVEQPNPETGKLCCRIDLSDERVNTWLGTSASKNGDLEVHGLFAGDEVGCILRIPLTVENVQQVETGTPYPLDDDIWVSHVELDAALAFYMNLDNWHGDWDSGHAYIYGDTVRQHDDLYFCIQAHTNQEPVDGTDSAYWVCLLEGGIAGADGNTILSGDGAPAGGTGNNGDFYIDTTGYDLYGPKTGGAWGSGTSIVGPQGEQGTAGVGFGAPVAWSASTTYASGDAVTYAGSIYGSLQAGNLNKTPPSNPTWWMLLVSKGEDGTDGSDGADGADGTDGTNGSQILRLSYNPTSGNGTDGDWAINEVAGGLWHRDSGIWTLIYTLDNGGFLPWENDNVDIGIQTLVQWDAPADGSCWTVYGIVGKASTGQIAFELLVSLRVEGASKTVKVVLVHTTEDGDCSDLAWGSDADTPYTDYDAGTGKVRVRMYTASNDWLASGKYLRGA